MARALGGVAGCVGEKRLGGRIMLSGGGPFHFIPSITRGKFESDCLKRLICDVGSGPEICHIAWDVLGA